MKIVDFICTANKKTPVKVDRLIDLKRYYLSMYRVHMVYLYDKGYINDPTRFDEKQIYSNIVDMKIKGMINMSGEIVLSSNQIRYAVYKNRGDSTIAEFLALLYKAVWYRELSQEVDNIYEEFGFSEEAKRKVSLNLALKGSRIISKSAYKVGWATMACLLKGDGCIAYKKINKYIWDIAMKELKIPKEDWKKDGLFDSSLSHDEEVECADVLLEGLVQPTGKYADVLTDWMFQHKWLEKGMSIDKKGLFSYTYVAYTYELLENIETVLSEIIESGKNVIGIVENIIYYEDEIKEYTVPIGSFAVQSGYDDSVMYEGNNLLGYTGEAYSLDYILDENIPFVGCPFELYVSCKDSDIFLDLEQVSIESDTWFQSENVEIGFDEDEEIGENPFKQGSLECKIYNMYRDSYKGKLLGTLDGEYSVQRINTAIKNVMDVL